MKRIHIFLIFCVTLAALLVGCGGNSARDLALVTGMSESQIKQLYEQGKAYSNLGDYASAYGNFSMVSGYRDAERLAQQALADYTEEIRSAIEQNINNGKYETALSLIESAGWELGDNSQFSDLAQQARNALKNEYLTQASDALAASDYMAALDYLQEARYVSDTLDAQATILEQEILTTGVQNALDKAEAIFDSDHNYDAAISIIYAAMDIFGETAELINALEEYESYIPIYLNDLEYFELDASRLYLDDHTEDNLGNQYSHSLYLTSGQADPASTSITFYLNGNYTSFSGICALPMESRSTNGTEYFEVYGDSTLLYTSPTMTGSSLPQNFEIDISNYTYLKIVYPRSQWFVREIAVICDPILRK